MNLKSGPEVDLTRLDAVFNDPSVPAGLRRIAPTSFAAAARYWQTILAGEYLPSRMKELVLVALHASATAIDSEAIRRHVDRALVAGASPKDVLDVLISIVGVANHALYFAVPILMNELKAAGRADAALPEMTPAVEAIKNDFIDTRGFWNVDRDAIGRLIPDYFTALSELSMEPWKNGSLCPKERELIFIAIDCSVTHGYGPGLAMHIRHALKHGARREEILEVFQLAALTGLEGYVLGAEALLRSPDSDTAKGDPNNTVGDG